MPTRPIGERFCEAKPFPEMLSVVTDPGLEVFQVTTDLGGAGNTRGAFFSPDGSRFFFSRHWGEGGLSGRVQYTLCEVNDGWALRVLTDEEDPRSPVVSHDGRHFYYMANETVGGRVRVVLKRVDLQTFERDLVAVYDAAVEGIGRKPRLVVPRIGSLRADGRMLCTGFSFATDDGSDHFAPVFIDLETLAIRGFEWEPYSWRVQASYFRGDDPAHRTHLLMGRANRSQHWDKDGTYTEKWYSDVHRSQLHVVSEDGDIVGTVPVGGAGEGVDHPYWRGGLYEVATHSGRFDTAPHWRGTIMSAEPIDCDPALWASPRHIPGARRVELTRKFVRPDVCHQSWHVDGIHGAFDTEGWAGRGTPCPIGPSAFLYLGTVVNSATEDPYIVTKYLLHPRSSWNSAFTENCQELSPDLRTVFFSSDWTCTFGSPQVFVARGFAFPKG
ncbi:MAG: hypothetical protein BWZ02_02519 [Lentisphaerae bacterium ADurb.BinA184]|nr:MAG: hypothetical protein BWZ02_02519 [Lentisphaerae bacterium ADurb.BinA184]